MIKKNMCKKWLAVVTVLCALLTLFLSVNRNRGNVNEASHVIGYSAFYSEELINEACDVVEKTFAEKFKGCTLTEIRYDEEVEAEFASEIENYAKEKEKELIVLLSAFETDEKGGDGSLNPNDTYTSWQWYLVRSEDKKRWELIDWGYKQEASRKREDKGEPAASSQQPDGPLSESPVALRNLSADGSLLSQTFYQAGNVNCRMSCYICTGEDGDEFSSGRLGISITEMLPHYSDIAEDRELVIYGETEVETIPGQNTYQAELAVSGYRDWEQVLEDTCSITVSLPAAGDPEGAVTLCFPDELPDGRKNVTKEISRLVGPYYRMDSERDLFVRYLCRAELCACPAEDLRLMRNTIYAAHGRTFQDPILTEYMEEKPWYRKLVEPEEFTERVLSDVERKNIAVLKELEEIPYGRRCMMYGADYSIEEFEEAPYLPFLSRNKETGLSADFTQVKDCGFCYSVPGKLYLPVTLTRKQWENVRAGEREELCINEQTGEIRILELDDTKNYRLYERGTTPDGRWPSDIRIFYQYDTGLYQLQEASDDTIMKLVYEGDLYFLKGSVWGGMVSLTTASELQEEITAQTGEIYANCLYHNGRGYFTAVYALGD